MEAAGALEEEVRFHLDAHAEDLIRAGVPRREAVRRARLHFGRIPAGPNQDDAVTALRHRQVVGNMARS